MAKSRQAAAAGVGASMLGQAIAYQRRGKVALDWRKEGLICRLTLPMTRATSSSALAQWPVAWRRALSTRPAGRPQVK
jgi:hypothetical protein